MDSFETNDDVHFWIKGQYDGDLDQFVFSLTINPSIMETGLKEFFAEVKEQLEKPRTLNATKEMIDDMLSHPNPTMQQLGKIVRMAADSVWVDYFFKSSLDNINPEEPEEPEAEDI